MPLRCLGMVDLRCFMVGGRYGDTTLHWCRKVYTELLEDYGDIMGLQSMSEILMIFFGGGR